MTYADIIVDISHEKVDRSFQYKVPEELQHKLQVGMVVTIPFGNGNHERKGYVIGLSDTPAFDTSRMKELTGICSSEETTEERLIALAAWMKNQYGSTMVQALRTVLPVREKVKAKEKLYIILNVSEEEAEKIAGKLESGRCKARARLVRALLEEKKLDYTKASKEFGMTASVLRPLADEGIVQVVQDEVYRMTVDGANIPHEELSILTEPQQEAFDQIQEIISMGGNFKSHGNCSPVAEYNYWVDPDAAALVYETAAQKHSLISMVGLDVTRKIVLTPDLLEYMKRLQPEIGSFVQKITKFYFDFHWEWEHLIGCVINDPLAVAYFADRSLCSGIQAYTAVETGGISMGQTVVDAMDFYRKEPNAVILTEVDVLKFFKTFYSSILQIPKEKLDLLETLITREDKKHE